jgi:hypothetical protein
MTAGRRAAHLLPLLLLGLAAACQRPLSTGQGGLGVGPETFAVRVTNETDRAMVVSYQDSHGIGVLGTVRAGSSTRFILDQVADREISISARSDVGDLTSGPYPVRLSGTVTPRVTLK